MTTVASTTWTVGKAAEAAGLSAKAVRLYEAKGLLPPAERTAAGYRRYRDDDIAVLRFIRQAKTLGLSLNEIRDILDLRRSGTTPCQHVVALLDDRIREIDRTITELRQLRRTLADARADAHQHHAEHADGVCGIIEHADDRWPART
ncbi:heavy metal-responsive transcriptional regulator [Amycolatopsis echigonensis]|uniref:Heavy metal-responsive transcriptional regulator n=1 Tax=Amycolatopsis echigonensis TaxID=2576905 RepID=A0A8E1W4G0_9PSEU|nr:heavy metal-responsive transcriptional regulator [Amycolatopsis echigonensis]MBB2504024.1 heavy metal-responsive transcriptional regulator [Amycolatopsis echigonensis]